MSYMKEIYMDALEKGEDPEQAMEDFIFRLDMKRKERRENAAQQPWVQLSFDFGDKNVKNQNI
jgi:hypothetical protein